MNFLALQQPDLFTDFILVPGPQTAGNEQDRLLSYWPQLAETTLPGFQEVFGTSLPALTTPQPHETLFSSSVPSRIICYLCLVGFISTPFVAESSVPKAAKSSIWQLGIGADPAQLLAETKTKSDVLELVRAWSPIFSQVGSIVLTTDKI